MGFVALRRRPLRLLSLCSLIVRAAIAQPTCNVQLGLTPDYGFAIGSSTGGSAFTFTMGGQTLEQGPMTQLALFHFDNTLNSTSLTVPTQSAGISFVPGKFGSAVLFGTNANLTYPQAGNLSLHDGTIEMWVSPRYDGDNSVYTNGGQTSVLFQYNSSKASSRLILAIGNHGGGPNFFVGAGNYYAGSPGASGIAGWKAGEWHHLAFTYSTTQSRIRIYVDGTLGQEVASPFGSLAAGESTFVIGSDGFGHGSSFALDEVRISNVEMPAGAIAFDAARTTPLATNEVFLPLAGVSPGQLTYSVAGCGTASYTFTGVPISGLSPPSGLLAPGSDTVTLSFKSLQPTTCRYSLGAALDYTAMKPMDTAPATAHSAAVAGLSTDPRVLNRLYLRCASNPDYLVSATWRVVAAPAGRFPRIGNIWLSGDTYQNAPEIAAKTQLFIGGTLAAADARTLRAQNPGVLILTSVQMNDVFDLTLPESYYLHDIHGNRISDWCSPTAFIWNMTRPEVATYVGQQAYQTLAQPNWPFDGMFFDSFGTARSVTLLDCHGNNVQVDANGDGLPDDQAQLNAAWAAGEYLAVSTFRSLAPGAYIMGHGGANPPEPRSLATFNGGAIEFDQQYVREGQEPFGSLWDLYQTWEAQAAPPAIMLMQSAPPNQLAYGYGYDPLLGMPPALGAFARAWYPNMRFGLALALMGDGFSVHDVGDFARFMTAWWYDEYDFDLGYPLGLPTRLDSAPSPPNLISNSGFENGLVGWRLLVSNDGHGSATASADLAVSADGASSARVAIASAGTAPWNIDLEQAGLPLTSGVSYQVQFWARADAPRTVTVVVQGGAPAAPNYGLSTSISIGTTWSLFSAYFISTATASDGRLEFWVGDVAGNVWLDDVRLAPAGAHVYRRDFTDGVVLLNATPVTQTVSGLSGLRRFEGKQAPLYQYIVDDAEAGFSVTGAWSVVKYNTGSIWYTGSSSNLPPEPQNAFGPYYHAWLGACHQLDTSSGSAQWDLAIPADGPYAIEVWLPAAPNASSWTKNAIYEVVANGSVVSSTTIDQTTAAAGDGWHTVATGVSLTAASKPFLRVHNGGSGSLIADAMYVTSAARYNDGSLASEVTLGAFDGILLERVHRPASGPPGGQPVKKRP